MRSWQRHSQRRLGRSLSNPPNSLKLVFYIRRPRKMLAVYTCKGLGIKFPDSILLRADEVIR